MPNINPSRSAPNAIARGRIARDAGESLGANPYKQPRGVLFQMWRKGWLERDAFLQNVAKMAENKATFLIDRAVKGPRMGVTNTKGTAHMEKMIAQFAETNPEAAREIFNSMIAQTTDANRVAKLEVAREFFTNPTFRNAMADEVFARVSQK